MEPADEFWAAYLSTEPEGLGPDARYVEAFRFGNTDSMADELAALVLAGVKTTTSQLLRAVETPIRPGDHSVVLDAAGVPVCVIRTVLTEVVPFDAVGERFAFDYGEGDRTLEWWRAHLWDYYADECRRNGWEADPQMPLLCETFRVVHPAPGRS
ncbi:ASCH domain-containing protein [Spirillospora sp. CA-294931]|uniref:ASCH domain-containing protein n=1 Tax=Spirillospora sp. CA-294931 TaxID=3240042 RepID=UPI003D9171A1